MSGAAKPHAKRKDQPGDRSAVSAAVISSENTLDEARAGAYPKRAAFPCAGASGHDALIPHEIWRTPPVCPDDMPGTALSTPFATAIGVTKAAKRAPAWPSQT